MRKRGIAESCASTKYPPSPAGGCPGALPLAGASPGRATSAQDRAPLENLHEKLAKKGSVVVRGEKPSSSADRKRLIFGRQSKDSERLLLF